MNLIQPRGKYIVMEEVDEKQIEKGIIFDSNEKDATKLYIFKVVGTGSEPDCADLVVGSKILCRKDDIQILLYKGREYFLIDEAYVCGYLND